jgi:hypothetical protein
MPRILPLVILDDDAFDAYLSDDDDNNNDAQQVIVIEDEGGASRCTMDMKQQCHTNLNHYLEVLDGIDGHQKKKRCRERVTNDNDNDINEDNVAMETHLRTRRWILIVVSFLPFLFSCITLVVMVLSGGHHRTSMTTKSEMLSTFQFDELGFVHEDIFIPP